MKGDRQGEAWTSFPTFLIEEPMDAGAFTAAGIRAKTLASAFAGTRIGRSPKMSRSPGPSTRPVRKATVTAFPVGGHEEILASRQTMASVLPRRSPVTSECGASFAASGSPALAAVTASLLVTAAAAAAAMLPIMAIISGLAAWSLCRSHKMTCGSSTRGQPPAMTHK